MVGDGRAWLAAQPLPVAAREQGTVALVMIDGIESQIAPLDRELRASARRHAGCEALMGHYGIGPPVAVTILAELGDCTRFRCSRHAVRYAGMDITVYQSDQHRAPGHLARQGPPALRWALFEAAQQAPRQGSPDRDYYGQAVERLGHNRACLAVARKLLKRSYHTLRGLGQEALAPASASPCAHSPSSHRCAAAGSRQPAAATLTWTALKDRAAATLPPAGSPHQTSCRRPGANSGRGPK